MKMLSRSNLMGIYASVQNPSETLPCKLCHLLRNVRSKWMQPDVGGGKNLEFHFLL